MYIYTYVFAHTIGYMFATNVRHQNIKNYLGYVWGMPIWWPCGVTRGSAVPRLLGMRFRISPGSWMSLGFGCFVFSGRGLYDGPISCIDDSYRVWCVWVLSRNLLQWRGLGQRRVVEQWEKKIYMWNLTFREPCFVIYSYNKTNEMH
jgi:hypothetical protein